MIKKSEYYLIGLIALTMMSCSKTVSDPGLTVVKITYEANIKPLISLRCTPCHLPPDGFKTYFNSYQAAKSYGDEMIRRIQLPRTDTMAMPYKFPALVNTEIQKFIQWKTDGYLEK